MRVAEKMPLLADGVGEASTSHGCRGDGFTSPMRPDADTGEIPTGIYVKPCSKPTFQMVI